MKAEAPEKIYVHKTAHLGLLTASKINITGNDVEYTRTDAFIERACEWLRTHSEVDYFEPIPYNYCGAGNFNKKRMIEDFKNYIEEEKV